MFFCREGWKDFLIDVWKCCVVRGPLNSRNRIGWDSCFSFLGRFDEGLALGLEYEHGIKYISMATHVFAGEMSW